MADRRIVAVRRAIVEAAKVDLSGIDPAAADVDLAHHLKAAATSLHQARSLAMRLDQLAAPQPVVVWCAWLGRGYQAGLKVDGRPASHVVYDFVRRLDRTPTPTEVERYHTSGRWQISVAA